MDELERIKREKLKKWTERMKGSAINQTEIEVNDENFQEKVIEQSKKIPVVDFWASWRSHGGGFDLGQGGVCV